MFCFGAACKARRHGGTSWHSLKDAQVRQEVFAVCILPTARLRPRRQVSTSECGLDPTPNTRNSFASSPRPVHFLLSNLDLPTPKSQIPNSLSNLSTSGARSGALFTKRARSLRKATRPNRGPEGLGLRRRGRTTVPQACEAPGGRSAPRRPSLAKAICLKF